MMPNCLKESGRALRERLIERDQLTDLQIVVSHCVFIVAEDQLTAASATLFNALSFPCLANETLDSLRALTGVAFEYEYATSGAASGAYGYSGIGRRPAGGAGSRQWCPTCSHAGTHHIGGADRPCFLDHRQPVNVPASVWTNQIRVDAMTKGREANARDLGITAGKLIPPSADAIKRYEEYAKDGKGGGKGGGRRGGGRGGGGRGGGAHAGAHVDETTCEWLDGLADLTNLTMATIDDTLLMNIKHAVDDAAALEAAADPADTTEDETAVGDEAWLSGIHEINGDGPVDGYSPYKPTVLDSPYKPTVLDSPHKLFKQSSLRDWLQATKPLEAHAVSSSGDGAPIEEEADIFFEEEAALGRARRSSEHGLPAASTTPQQALQAELATTSTALPPTTPGAPGYLKSSVLAEFLSLCSAFFVGGTGPGGDYAQSTAKDDDGITASALPWRATPPAEELAPATATADRLPSTPASASGLDTTVKFTPAPTPRSCVPPPMRDVAITPIPGVGQRPRATPTPSQPDPATDDVSRRLSLSASGPRTRSSDRSSDHSAGAGEQLRLAPGSIAFFIFAFACGALVTLATCYLVDSYSSRLAIITGAGAALARAQQQLGGVGAAVDGLVAAARWVANLALEHKHVVIYALFLAYSAAARAGPVTGAGARPAPVGRTLAGSARYDTYCPLLTRAQACQLHVELLAGNEPPPSLPDAIAKCLVIVDTGCGRSMGNHPLQFKAGSIREKVTTATGAHGSFKTMFEGTWAMPMQTESHGICMYGECDAVLHEACPYALWSPGRASIECGVSLSMPAWGKDGFVEFTSGICVSFINQHVLVLRPLGYKASCPWPGGRPGAGTPEKTETQDMKASSNARQRNRRGAAPKHRGGKHHKGGNRLQGNPTRQHAPHRESSTRRGPRCKIGRGGRRSSDFCVKQRTPPTAGSCSHRVAEKLYASKEDPRTSA